MSMMQRHSPPDEQVRPVRPAMVVRLREPMLLLAGVAAAGAVLHTVDPGQPGHYPGCPLLWLTGLYCPFCGGLRCVADLTHGQVADAFARNPLLPPVLLIAAVLWVRWVVQAARGRGLRPRLGPRSTMAVLAVMVVFGVMRNIPGWTWLSPV